VKLGHAATDDKGIKDPYITKVFGYKKVDREKQAKQSKGTDYVDLHNATYK